MSNIEFDDENQTRTDPIDLPKIKGFRIRYVEQRFPSDSKGKPIMNNDPQLRTRVEYLLSTFSDPGTSTASLLCDRHPSSSVAYTIVAPDLTATDLTYGALRNESEHLASAFSSLGLRSGDRIATLMGKSREYLVTVMAIWRLGAIHVPLFTAFAPASIAYRLKASRAKLVVCDPMQRPKLASDGDMRGRFAWRIVTTGQADPYALAYDDLLASGHHGFTPAVTDGNTPIIEVYTSGTTGEPKGVLVPRRAIASFQIYAEYGLGIRNDDMFWNAADPGWAYGLYFGIIASFSTGVHSVLLRGGFSVEATYGVLGQFGVTNFAAAPTVLRSLRGSKVSAPPDLRLRSISSAGEPLTDDVSIWSMESLGVPVHDHYGQTEAGMLINNHHHPALRRPLRPGAMGHPMPGWHAAILDLNRDEPASLGALGRVAIRIDQSPLAWFTGYLNDSEGSGERFSKDGHWYITGDTGRVDEDGYFYFSAREDDVILMAGYRIGPAEIEAILSTHQAVRECAVIAAPDEVRGEILEAVVVLNDGFTPTEELTAQLQEWVKKGYGAHAYPRRVHYHASLPRTPSGKVQRFVLRQALYQGLAIDHSFPKIIASSPVQGN
jgi:acetyl-CoA synthetase